VAQITQGTLFTAIGLNPRELHAAAVAWSRLAKAKTQPPAPADGDDVYDYAPALVAWGRTVHTNTTSANNPYGYVDLDGCDDETVYLIAKDYDGGKMFVRFSPDGDTKLHWQNTDAGDEFSQAIGEMELVVLSNPE